ncbi:MAG: 1-deoxy-D-xylulose 5-phosphate synthase, partial [uncultured Ramlibacter sp.]
HLRHRALVHQHLGGAGHGPGRAAQGRGPQGHRHHRRRRHERRHGVRGLEQCRRGRVRPAGGAQRQRHVDQPSGRRVEPLPGPADERALLRHRQDCRQERAVDRTAAVRAGQALRGACQGHGGAGHAVREVRLQLHRPDRRARPRFAGADAGEHPPAQGPAVPACGHQEGAGLQAGRERPGGLPRAGQVRSQGRHHGTGHAAPAHLHPGVRPVAVRHGRAGSEAGRHHAGHARRLGAGGVRKALPRALLRRGHRRTACGHVRGRSRLRGPEAGAGDLFHLPAARLRPVDPRRGAAEAAGGVRARSRRPRGCRRGHARGRVRHRVPALHPERERGLPGRRERMPAAADHRLRAGASGGGPLPARRRRGCAGAGRTAGAAVRQGRGASRAGRERWRPARCGHPGVRHPAVPGVAGRRAPGRHRGEHAVGQAAGHRTAAAHRRRARRPGHGGRGLRRRRSRRGGRRGPACSGHREAAPAAGAARRLHRARRSGQAAGAARARRRGHRVGGARPLRRTRGPRRAIPQDREL